MISIATRVEFGANSEGVLKWQKFAVVIFISNFYCVYNTKNADHDIFPRLNIVKTRKRKRSEVKLNKMEMKLNKIEIKMTVV